jgi:hypothetical protein
MPNNKSISSSHVEQTTLLEKMVDRRKLLTGCLSSAMLIALETSGRSQGQEISGELFDAELATAANSISFLDSNRQYRERYAHIAGLEAAPIDASPSYTPISQRAINLIVACEVSGKANYEARYQKPIWPKGRSGVTIGVGYDVGYSNKTRLESDWKEYLSKQEIDNLTIACGRIGEGAQLLVSKVQSVVIPWNVASSQFSLIMLPRYVGLTERALPNFEKLSPDSRGALVSLVYNRGPSFNADPSKDRYREMRAIKAAMQSGEFDEIPAQIRSMIRLWANDKDATGLPTRRNLEADLFELGLKA